MHIFFGACDRKNKPNISNNPNKPNFPKNTKNLTKDYFVWLLYIL